MCFLPKKLRKKQNEKNYPKEGKEKKKRLRSYWALKTPKLYLDQWKSETNKCMSEHNTGYLGAKVNVIKIAIIV